ATQVACLSQLRQIGQGLVMYDHENKKLPYMLVEVDASGQSGPLGTGGSAGGKRYTWQGEVSVLFGTERGDGSFPRMNPVFRCPDAQADGTDAVWQDIRFTYHANPRLIPPAAELAN